jgi:hypothetical protein
MSYPSPNYIQLLLYSSHKARFGYAIFQVKYQKIVNHETSSVTFCTISLKSEKTKPISFL